MKKKIKFILFSIWKLIWAIPILFFTLLLLFCIFMALGYEKFKEIIDVIMDK